MPISRYRTYGPEDDQPNTGGDVQFVGVDYYSDKTNIEPGFMQSAVNADFTTSYCATRGGFVCLPELGNAPFGMTWTTRTAASSNNWRAVTYGNGMFVAVSTSGVGNRVMTSPDGITWTSRTSAADYSWTDIAWSGSLFAACAASGTTDRIMTSSNGTSWSLATTPNGTLTGICYGNGKFVAVGGTANLVYSTDGVTWLSGTIPSSISWQSVAYGNGIYTAVSAVGDAAYSSDGITFTISSVLPNVALTDVTYGNGIFVAIAANGSVWTSADGDTWTQRTASNDNAWFTITYGAGTFVAVANSGSGDYYVMTSRNGIGWVNRTAASNSAWRGIAYGNGTFVAVASNNVMTTNVNDQTVFACGEYSPPSDPGAKYIVLVGRTSAGFYAFGQNSRTVSFGSYTVTEQSTIVQCGNYLYLFRGDSSVPLYWDGQWATNFTAVPEAATPAAGFQNIPYSNQATYAQNRLWVRQGKDYVAASDVLDFTTYDLIANDFNINTGSSDYVVATFPFGQDGLIAFKNKSILLLQNVTGSLSDVTVSEVTRQVGLIGINAVTSIGPDLAYVSDRNINLLTLTNTNNSVQHKTLPLSVRIRSIMERVNWDYGYKISVAFWDNKLFVALPLDNATVCNSVVVYSFINEAWFGEWNFAEEMNMSILGWATANYLGLQRLHAVSEDGRIFVVGEGWQDISGTVFADIAFNAATRAYNLTNTEQIQRRAYIDISTLRPTFSVVTYAPGVSESSDLITGETYRRSASWLADPATYNLNNSGDNYNTAYRKDYAALCSESVQPQSGFYPEQEQTVRLPLMCGRNGRYFWLEIANSTGLMRLQGAGFETREGSRSNLIQI